MNYLRTCTSLQAFSGQGEQLQLSHVSEAKKELATRINRIQGQLDGIKNAVQEDQDCATVLQQVAACRGAINSLMVEIIEGEITGHVLSRDARPRSSEARAADELVRVLRRYLK
jgi:DNA-binding FrmR family transcriptional regulator